MNWKKVSSSRRWNAELASEVLDEFEDSGLSVADFARQHGLCPQRIGRWRTRLQGSAGVEGLTSGFHPFVELVAPPSPASVGSQKLSVHCPSGHTIELVGADAAGGLDLILRTLARMTC